MSAVCEKKHDTVIQQFVEEATMVKQKNTQKLSKCQRKLKELEHASNFENYQTPVQKRSKKLVIQLLQV